MKKTNKIIVAVFILLAIVTGGVLAITRNTADDTTANVPKASSSTQADTKQEVTAEDRTKAQLLYLIEEEKLAHDVYTVMYQKYGAKVFGNILESESTHQARVLTLLQARGIADPRSSELGVFNNAELQTLYDNLIAQGSQSAAGAYRAGVTIEEKDIEDISVQLSTADGEDVIATLEDLRKGSENHLRAFNRQIR